MEIYDMPGHLIRRLQQASTQVFAAEMRAAGIDLTSVQFAALAAIRARPGIDQAGVAAAIAYDRATIGGVIDRLERKGLVERTVSDLDRRARVLRPTPKGDAAYREALPAVLSVQTKLMAGLSETERAEFMRLLRLATGTASNVPAG